LISISKSRAGPAGNPRDSNLQGAGFNSAEREENDKL
jgi:hypothetical protein